MMVVMSVLGIKESPGGCQVDFNPPDREIVVNYGDPNSGEVFRADADF